MKPYTEDDVQSALEAISAGAGAREAASHWGIPRSTLYNRRHGAQSHSDASNWQMRLSSNQETELTQFALDQATLGLPLTHFELRSFAGRMTTSQARPPPLGRNWLAAFLVRNPEIRSIQSRQMHFSRINGAKTEIIKLWFNLLRLPAVLKVQPKNCHNVDEGGIAEGEGSNGMVIGPEGRKLVYRKSNGGKIWTLYLECISATGKACPPLVIFKGKHVQQQWFKTLKGHEDWEFTATKNGWTDNAVALEWLQKIFIPWTAPEDPSEWRLLVLDGHKSHCTFEFMWECFSNKIYIVYLLPHISHILQPLDVGVFLSLKAAYKHEADNLSFFFKDTFTGKQLFLWCFRKARLRALSERNITSGWRGTGLWPVNMAKPLINAILAENAVKEAKGAKIKSTTRKRRVEIVTPVPITVKKSLLSTPRASRELRVLHGVFDQSDHSNHTRRLLFRKIEKGYDEKDWQLKMLLRENEILKARLEAAVPVKRRKVETSPNSRFVNIRAIRRAQIAAGAIEAESADEEGSDEEETPENCIVVATTGVVDEDEVEG